PDRRPTGRIVRRAQPRGRRRVNVGTAAATPVAPPGGRTTRMVAQTRRPPHERIDDLTTCFPYVRVSTDEQAQEGLSLPAQIEAIRRYAAGRGWMIAPEHVDVMSGRRTDRPQYRAMLAEVERLRAAGKPVAVAVVRVDRLGRDLIEGATTYKKLKHAAI